MQKANENAAAKHDEGVKDQQYSSNQDTPWLRKGIVVKIINKTLAEGKYHKMKGYVKVWSQMDAQLLSTISNYFPVLKKSALVVYYYFALK